MTPDTLAKLSVQQLKRALKIRQEIDRLEAELAGLLGGAAPAKRRGPARRKRRMSAAGRAAIAAAARARWAKWRAAQAAAAKTGAAAPAKRRPKISAEG